MSGPDKTKLAIILPTYRFDAIACQALVSVAAMGSEDICVHIADNSENPDKHAFLRVLAARSTNVVVHCHAQNIGAEANWLFLLKMQTADFICLAADDDSFLTTYFRTGLDLISSDPRCAAASGLFVSMAYKENLERPLFDSPDPRLEAKPLDRIQRFHGVNAIAYAVVRREIINAFAEYVAQNPLKGPFNDYLLTFHLLSMGTYQVSRSAPIYLYDNAAWQFPENEWRSGAKFYVGCGLSESFQHLFKLHWAVANVHFFESRFRAAALSDTDASAIAAYLFDRLRDEFIVSYLGNRAEVDALFDTAPDAHHAFMDLINLPYSKNLHIFERFTRVVRAFSSEMSMQLDTFQRSTLLPGFMQPTPEIESTPLPAGIMHPAPATESTKLLNLPKPARFFRWWPQRD